MTFTNGDSPQINWPLPPPDIRLGENEAHVWAASLSVSDEALQQFTRLLSSEEQVRAAAFHFDRDRDRFIASRGILRRILSRYLGLSPEEITLNYGRHGKPRLAEDAPARLHFNLSHSGALVLCAVARDGEVGVDVEQIAPVPEADAIAARFFSKEEQCVLSRLEPVERLREFFKIWTRREAVLKATGTGINEDLDAPGSHGCWVGELPEPAEDYVAALAVDRRVGVHAAFKVQQFHIVAEPQPK